ncbi:MAG: phosphate ABC transporter permease PstA [Firmicutes bacterium]|jgi:phosphate transport system permease protein|nr:phosphate ABC transporter permease PstA [Bacillota bacterium]
MLKRTDRIAFWVFAAATAVALSFLVFIISFVFVRGIPRVTWSFLTERPRDMGRAGGILPSIVGTIALTGLALLIGTPLGVATAVYLTEYTREGMSSRVIRFGAESLAGVPSIIFGLFGFLFFVIFLGFGWSILSGGLTLALMILPTIIRTSEEAIRAVPREYREISLSLGASRWQTVVHVVLPAALPGVITGVMLSLGRAVGETAAVIFTAGSSLRLPGSIMDPVRTLPVHFYVLAREGISMANAYGTATVLLATVLLIEIAANILIARFSGHAGRG